MSRTGLANKSMGKVGKGVKYRLQACGTFRPSPEAEALPNPSLVKVAGQSTLQMSTAVGLPAFREGPQKVPFDRIA